MSRSSFAFSSTALRSLERDEAMLERHRYKQQLASRHLSSYMLRKELSDRAPLRSALPPPRPALPPPVCHDLVIQNALYTGDMEALRRLFPRGSRANLVIEPQGGDMRWVAEGEVASLRKRCKTEKSMAYMAPKIKWYKPKIYRNDVIATAKATGYILDFWKSLLKGDASTLSGIVDNEEHCYLIDAIYDTSNVEEWKNFRFNYRSLRLWLLSYEQVLTTPLHITAGRGFADCLQFLLERGADVELSPSGVTALHESCENCESECTKLLLSYGANANAVSEEGQMPLHMCTNPQSFECAEHLLQYGAAINGCTVDEADTPLHVAAKNGLLEHIELYLRFGAEVDKRNNEGITPLCAACSQPQEAHDLRRYFTAGQMLIDAGANIHAQDQDSQTPLHQACKNANADLVDLLLEKGASVNDMNYGGEAPMHNILKVVCYKASHQPERIVRALLNHGSIRVWPGALPTVLKHCSESPRTIEVLLNAYTRLKVNDTWVESVPDDILKEHKEFYESVFSLAMTPRSLQHLARCKVRSFLAGRIPTVVPQLELPNFIKKYLLLGYRGYIH